MDNREGLVRATIGGAEVSVTQDLLREMEAISVAEDQDFVFKDWEYNGVVEGDRKVFTARQRKKRRRKNRISRKSRKNNRKR